MATPREASSLSHTCLTTTQQTKSNVCATVQHTMMWCKQDVRAANVRALSDSLVLTCHRDDFQTHLGRLTDIRRLWRFEALRKVAAPQCCCLSLIMPSCLIVV